MVLLDVEPQRMSYQEFAPREVFLEEYSSTLTSLIAIEESGSKGMNHRYRQVVDSVETSCLPPAEKELLMQLCNVFAFKWTIGRWGENPGVTEAMKGRGNRTATVEIVGPPGIGKTTLARGYARRTGAEFVAEQFTPDANRFLAPSYDNHDLLLPSQLWFLIYGWWQGVIARGASGIAVFDTSSYSNSYIFFRWKERANYLQPHEIDAYWATYRLMEHVIPKPDVVVALVPDNISSLSEGITERRLAESLTRAMEGGISDNDLGTVTACTREAIGILRDKELNVLSISLDPRELYHNPTFLEATCQSIQEKLDEVLMQRRLQ